MAPSNVLSVYYDRICIKFASHHLLLYVVYMSQKSLNFTYAFKCYQQNVSGFTLAGPPCMQQRLDVDADRRRRLEAFEMWIWRRMANISWLDKVTNEEVLRRVNEDRQILNSIYQRKHRWMCHVLRHY